MKIIAEGTPKEIAELLQAIGSSKEQLKFKLPVAIKDDKVTFREGDLSKNEWKQWKIIADEKTTWDCTTSGIYTTTEIDGRGRNKKRRLSNSMPNLPVD